MDTNTAVLAGIGMVCLTILWIVRLIAQNSAESFASDAYKKADSTANELHQLRYRVQEVERKISEKH